MLEKSKHKVGIHQLPGLV